MEKYKLAVLEFYEQKKSAGELSANLIHFTPANIRNEFRLLFSAGCDNTDKRTLKEFFELPFDREISDLAVRKCDPDKFKPLCNFLKKGIQTREKNIELLAWLIDFRPRPFSNYSRTSNGKTDRLSALSITERGIVEQMMIDPVSRSEYTGSAQREPYGMNINSSSKTNQHGSPGTAVADYPYLIPREKEGKKVVTLEYPTGVKLSVDVSDLSLIAQLIRL
ncbi:MAG: hypothetical protein WC716_11825 [Chitinophagaceae bacterium]